MVTVQDTGLSYVVGIDLGGTKIRAGIATSLGTILADRVVPTGTGGDLVRRLVGLVSELAREVDADPAQIRATAVGGAGVPDGDGSTFRRAPNLHDVGSTPFARDLSTALAHPVVLENDVNAAALGELHHGLGRTHSSFAFVSVGTGIGMGVVIEGRLVRGARGAAGEVGFLPLGADPLIEENQRHGPLEEVVGGVALAGHYRRATGEEVTSEEVFRRAAAGDVAGIEAIDHEGYWIAAALVAVDAILDPELFVLGGGIGSHPYLLPRVRAWLIRLGAPHIEVRVSELGLRAPVVGAVHLALDAAELNLKGANR